MKQCLGRVVAILAGCCSLALYADARSQTNAAGQAAYMAGLRVDRSMLAGPLAPSPRTALRVGGASEYNANETREVNLIGRGVVLEMPHVAADGSFQRPRVLIGRQSPELQLWMKEIGLAPERCMLPMFRGRLKRDPNTGKAGAAVLVSARCTFF